MLTVSTSRSSLPYGIVPCSLAMLCPVRRRSHCCTMSLMPPPVNLRPGNLRATSSLVESQPVKADSIQTPKSTLILKSNQYQSLRKACTLRSGIRAPVYLYSPSR
ncbi:uncharacterized protein LOC113470469 [Diaphorina citri]|uniref:Uncharacterized protein LOC113470469 n=1 Tax=Diaphorina citri TaxID=121845 RepID=A0A3Q0J8D5_DIACI|nr:uncharacterized protein LOC113470469 [Diaphorina citri]